MAQGRKTGGRKKGTPNKVTADVRSMVLASLDKVGGIGYLVKQSEENPTAYMTLVGKCMPTKIEGDADNPLKHIHEIRIVGQRAS